MCWEKAVLTIKQIPTNLKHRRLCFYLRQYWTILRAKKTKQDYKTAVLQKASLSFSLFRWCFLQYLALLSSSPPSAWLPWLESRAGLDLASEWDLQLSAFLWGACVNLGLLARCCSLLHCLNQNLLPVWSHSWPGRLRESLLLSRKTKP